MTRETERVRTEDGYQTVTTTTGPDGQTRQRTVTGTVTAEDGAVVRDVTVDVERIDD